MHGSAESPPRAARAERELERLGRHDAGKAAGAHQAHQTSEVGRPPGELIDAVQLGERHPLPKAEALDHVYDYGAAPAHAMDPFHRGNRILEMQQEISTEQKVESPHLG